MIGELKSKEYIAEGTLLAEFDLGGQELKFQAGQSLPVKLIQPLYTDDKGDERYFSIVNSPNDAEHLLIATRISDSAYKRSLKEMPAGSRVELGEISGKLILPEEKERELVFIAGGIGITPFISMLRFVKEENTGHKISLIYSNRSRETTAFLGELQSYETEIPDFNLILTMTDDEGWKGETRMVSAQLIKEYFPNFSKKIFMVVGPPPMVQALYGVLNSLQLSSEQIKFEVFTGY